VTHLRKRMLEELQRRNYSEGTTRAYLHAVEQFARHFGKSPDKLGPDDLRSYQAYLLVERKLAVGSVVARVAALRFFFVRTLKRRDFREDLPVAFGIIWRRVSELFGAKTDVKGMSCMWEATPVSSKLNGLKAFKSFECSG
jgi:hypothetical protein